MMNSMHGDRLLRRAEVQTITGLGTSSIYLLMHKADEAVRFPQPIKIGERSRWLEGEVHDWIARQAERSRRQAA